MLNSIRFFLFASGIFVLNGCGGEETVETSDAVVSNETTAANSVATVRNKAPAANSVDPDEEAFPVSKKFPRAGDNDDPKENDRVTAETTQVPENTAGSTESTQGSSKSKDLPNSLESWTDDHFVLAVRRRDARLTEAISIRAKSDLHRPTFVSLAKQLLEIATEPPDVVKADADDARPSKPDIRDDNSRRFGSMTPGKLSARRAYDNDDDDSDDDDPGRSGAVKGITPPQPSANTRAYDNDDDDSDDDDPGRSGGFKGITPGQSPAGNSNQSNSVKPIPANEARVQHQIVKAVVQGLLVNDSPEAWETLQAVLSHQQQTPLNLKQASIVVFEEVFGSEQMNVAMAEKLAVFVLNSPDQMQVGMNLLASLGSQVSRMHLHLPGVSPSPPGSLKPTPATGLKPTPATGGINSVPVRRAYDNDDDDSDDDDPGRSRGFRGITPPQPSANTRAYDNDDDDSDDDDPGRSRGFRGITPPQPSVGNPNQTNSTAPVSVIQLPRLDLSPEALEASTEVLHGSTFLDTLKETLENTSDLSSGRSTLLLASILPDVKLRHAMYNVFSAEHHRGAEKLLDIGFYDRNIVRDPVHLLVLKSLPRQRKGRTGSAQQDALGQAGVTWAKATLEMVLSVRDQMRQAAKNDPELAWDEKVPLRLHRRAMPDVSIQLTIEDGSGSGDEAPAGTQVYYSRCRVMPADNREIKQLIAHYESQSKGIQRAFPERDMLWFDGIQAGSDGTRMTKDVLVTKAYTNPPVTAQGGGGSPSSGQSDTVYYTVEAITIVAADPRLSQESEKPAEE